MSNELIVSSRTSVSPHRANLRLRCSGGHGLWPPRLARCWRRRCWWWCFRHAMNRTSRYCCAGAVMTRCLVPAPSPMDFTRPDITEEELNSEVELLRDEDLLKKVVAMAELVPLTPGFGAGRGGRTCGPQTVAPPRCGGAEEVESDPGSLQGHESGKGCARAVGALDCVCAKAYESAAAPGRISSSISKLQNMKRDCINPKPNWCASLALGRGFGGAGTRHRAAEVGRSGSYLPADRRGSRRDRAADGIPARTAQVVSLAFGDP